MHGWRRSRTADLTDSPGGGALPPSEVIASDVQRALAEDIGAGDVTAALVPATQRVSGTVVCREAAVLCGSAWFAQVFRELDASISVSWQFADGDAVLPGATLCSVAGPARAVLSGERSALNFLQTLSATATATRRFVDAVRGTGCQILDTRKTLPGLRRAQKYATRCGGARNHRMGLFDMVLIKENHIVAAGSIEAAVSAARRLSPGLQVEVEAESLDEFARALAAGADIIMLDELSLDDMRAAVASNRAAARPCRIEASGSMTLERVRAVAETGVDYISVGGITKSIQAADLSMRLRFGAAP